MRALNLSARSAAGENIEKPKKHRKPRSDK
jgi:hypothetical protein